MTFSLNYSYIFLLPWEKRGNRQDVKRITATSNKYNLPVKESQSQTLLVIDMVYEISDA